MKRLLALICALCLFLCALSAPALASANATPNQRLALRTGPNTAYVELYTLPQSTRITAYEYEEGNGVTWVLVEYTYQGSLCRGYTGLKRMTVNGSIPWASHLNQRAAVSGSCTVLGAPASNGSYRSTLSGGTTVTILEYENGYAFIEFYDSANRANSRGYIPTSALQGSSGGAPQQPQRPMPPQQPRQPQPPQGGGYGYGYGYASGGVPATPNQKLALRTGPNTAYVELHSMPQSTQITAFEYEEGNDVTWVQIEYVRNGEVCRGYTGLKRMTVHGNIPWAQHLYEYATLSSSCTVYAAPSERAAYRATLYGGAQITILGYENNYAFIEFYDYSENARSRGYIEVWAL